jgi:hypothetical protein
VTDVTVVTPVTENSEKESFSFATTPSNGHKPAPQANTFQVGQVIRYKGKPVTIDKIGSDWLLVEEGKDRHMKRIDKADFSEIKSRV